MKKLMYTLIAILFFNITVYCQAHYVFIDFKDAQRPAIQNEFSFSDKTVSDAIEDKLGKMGYKGKDNKGYTVYKGVVLPELGGRPYDLYFKADKRSRKDKDNTVLSMLISSGNENFISDVSDSLAINNAKNFLNNLLPAITAYDFQQQVNAQQDAVTKAEKKYKSLQDDADDLQKKKKKLEQQIEDNLKAQKDQQAEIEKQRQLFETIKSRQKN
ncbi:MAG: hypothetical protein JWN83_2376 [Chitinophagaceae bacterium]|nr:hypothetical protein [Chitinophagaceae bacterium]